MNNRENIITQTLRLCAFAVIFLLFLISNTKAQRVDTLHEVKIHGRHNQKISNDARINEFSPGQKIKAIDSITKQQYQYRSLSSLLSEQSPVFVRSYGFNSLATLNFRGSSAAQSEVLWNGVPIQNAALGIADVSVLPVLLMDKVNLVYGSSSALWGSGNVGGALLLENDAPVFETKKSLSLFAGTGSFGECLGGLKTSFSNKKWFLSLKAFGQSALNNYTYTTDSGITKKIANAKLQGGSIELQSAYKVNEHNTIGLSAWYQHYYREIAPALFESSSLKKYTTGSLRLLLNWDRKTQKNTWYTKASLMQDELDYKDPTIYFGANSLNAKYTTYQYFQEIGWSRKLNEHNELLVFSPIQICWMQVGGLIKQQSKAAIAAAYSFNYFDHKLNMAINTREEEINNTNILLPGINASYDLFYWLKLRANVQRTYRAPTLNELYFNPGGDTALKPEQGWNEDAGYNVKIVQWRNCSIEHDLSVFNRDIHDWILWFGGAIFTPHNIATVQSRGVETENRFTYTFNKWKLHLGLNTSYIIATTQSSYIPNDGSIDKQIPYTPRYNGQLNIGFTYGKLYFNYNHTYTGYRFYTTDESLYLFPYNIGNVQLMYNMHLAHYPIQLNAQCNNIWNSQYQVAAGRPMPGINWLLGVRLSLL